MLFRSERLLPVTTHSNEQENSFINSRNPGSLFAFFKGVADFKEPKVMFISVEIIGDGVQKTGKQRGSQDNVLTGDRGQCTYLVIRLSQSVRLLPAAQRAWPQDP